MSSHAWPTYDSLQGVELGALYGFIAAREPAVDVTFEFTWQRDRARLDAVEAALLDLATHRPIGEAAKPRWLDGLVRGELRRSSERYWSRDQFVFVRLVERLGAVDLEPDDTYVLAMVSALGEDKVEKLRADPGLVERALWRVFEVEGGGEVSLTNVDRFGGEQWRSAFLELTADGTLDRGRVLDECLRALGRDFAAYRAGWFSATFLALAPTPDEAAARQAELRRLLNASVPATVAFAVKQLRALEKQGLLDMAATVPDLGPATLVKSKGTALDALRLAKSAGPDHRADIAAVATTALGHPHADVQRAAADLLRLFGDADDLDHAQADLAPSVRADLGLGATVIEPSVHVQTTQQLRPPAQKVGDNDLSERVAGLLEDASDPAELDAVIARLAAPGSEAGLRPLTKRALRVAEQGADFGVGDVTVSAAVARTVLSLLGERAPTGMPSSALQRFVINRLTELRSGDGPLLATPDLPGGWVSPAALVERLATTRTPRHHDVVAALLRLHPENREDALRPGLPPAVEFALTGSEPGKKLFRSSRPGPEAWWTAAQRSRAPYDESERPSLSSQFKTHSWEQNGTKRTHRYVEFTVIMSTRSESGDDRPTELGSKPTGQFDDGQVRSWNADWVGHLAAIWPHDTEHYLTLTGLSVLGAAGYPEVSHDVPRTLDSLATHPGRMGTLAVHTLAAGLSAAKRDHRFHAIDAFADLVPTGRISISDLASALATYAEAWPATRLAESLASCSQAPGGVDAVIDLLVELLPQLPIDHRGINKLLDVLRDETLRRGSAALADEQLRAWLATFSGSSAAARTARALLG